MALQDDIRQSAMAIRRLQSRLHDSAYRASAIKLEQTANQEQLNKLEAAHPEWGNPDSRLATNYFFLVAGIIAVYVLDIFLFGPTVEYLSKMTFSGIPIMTWVARLLVPAAVLCAEILLASVRFTARQKAETYPDAHTEYWIWLGMSVLFVFLMPCLVIGTSLVQFSIDDETVKAGLKWQLVALVILSFTMHVLIIFGGTLLHEAKSYLAFKHSQRSLSNKIQFCNREYNNESKTFRHDFDDFCILLERHLQTYQANFKPGPFDTTIRRFSHDIYGHDVISPPDNSTPMTPQSTTFRNTDINNMTNPNSGDIQSPEQGNDHSAEGTTDLTNPRIREEESEVRV